jgi:hypothetical protein
MVWLVLSVPLFVTGTWLAVLAILRRRSPKVMAQAIYMSDVELPNGVTHSYLKAEGRISDLPWRVDEGLSALHRRIRVGWNGHWATCVLTSFTWPGFHERFEDDPAHLEFRVRGDWTAELESAWTARNRVEVPR